MNKYSLKLKTYIDNNFADTLPQTNYQNSVKYISDTIEKIINLPYKSLTSTYKSQIKKISETKPIIYQLLLSAYNDGLLVKYFDSVPNLNNFDIFIDWWRKNYHLININKISQSYTTYNKILSEPHPDRKKLHQLLYDNNFVFIDTMIHAETSDLIYEKYQTDIMNLDLYWVNATKPPQVGLMYQIVEFMQLLSGSDLKVNLTVFYGNQKKYLTAKKFISAENINSGSTLTGIEMMLWRKEEFYKVFIHELVHYFDMDFNSHSNIINKLETHCHNTFQIDGTDRANEAYTEILALTIHSILYAKLKNISFDEVIRYEMLFTFYQIAKLICWYGGAEYKDLFKIKIYQSTSLCSYIICKGMMFANYQKILDFWTKYGIINTGKSDRNSEFLKLYKQIVREEGMSQIQINLINLLIYSIKNHQICEHLSFIKSTLRMTLFQI